jgi:hypothetical protein
MLAVSPGFISHASGGIVLANLSGVTQFGRALHDLNIELICANSSQAKGRVERANLTLQDRLVKEMRLESISGIDNANAWLETFISDFNRSFGRPATYPKNQHRPVSETCAELDNIFAWQTLRTLSKSLRFQYDKMLYLVKPTEENARIAGENIMAFDYPDGTIAFRYGNRTLRYQIFDKLACVDQGRIVDNKMLGTVLKLAQENSRNWTLLAKENAVKICPRGTLRFRNC